MALLRLQTREARKKLTARSDPYDKASAEADDLVSKGFLSELSLRRKLESTRKLDEIDRRLSEWRDKEIANRIRILKITLWASVIVAGISLLYSYVMRYLKEYSALVKHARATDRAEVLTTTFSTSDMGKLYMLLSKAMEAGAMDQAS